MLAGPEGCGPTSGRPSMGLGLTTPAHSLPHPARWLPEEKTEAQRGRRPCWGRPSLCGQCLFLYLVLSHPKATSFLFYASLLPKVSPYLLASKKKI